MGNSLRPEEESPEVPEDERLEHLPPVPDDAEETDDVPDVETVNEDANEADVLEQATPLGPDAGGDEEYPNALEEGE